MSAVLKIGGMVFPNSPHFYVGCHRVSWLWNGKLTVPAFVSHHALRCFKNLHPATIPWALDSGGFTEVSTYGEWRTTPREYVEAVAKYDREIGHLEWAAPQDWMCEPFITAKTGLTVAEHQARTVANFIELTRLWGEYSDDSSPFMPVLQGWQPADYHACVAKYEAAGVDLAASPLVGLGSVCRRQATDQIGTLIEQLSARGYRLHGFGCKTLGVARYGHLLASADSMAWSFNARKNAVLPGHEGLHKTCANCPEYAAKWLANLAARIEEARATGTQSSLFAELEKEAA